MKPVLVTTENRGVFFGYLETEPTELPAKITLKNMRNCISWQSSIHGVFGLASSGPDKNCRIGPKVPSATLYKITCTVDCTPEATEKWELGAWL